MADLIYSWDAGSRHSSPAAVNDNAGSELAMRPDIACTRPPQRRDGG
jgi:hypothetical protein